MTGIRQDSYAKEHPIVVEEAKKTGEAGALQFVPKGSSARLMSVGPSVVQVSGGALSPTPHIDAAPLQSRP